MANFKWTISKKSKIQVCICILFLLISIIEFYWLNLSACIPLVIVGIIDLYIVVLLVSAAALSDKNKGWYKEWLGDVGTRIFPTRVIGLLLFLLFLVIYIFSFGDIYFIHRVDFSTPIQTRGDAFYVSFQILTTLGEGSSEPALPCLKNILIFEVFSALNLLLGGLALLVSRLSSFED